jgi:predicted phosphodiesterase
MATFSRRDFLKTASTGMALSAGIPLLGGCSRLTVAMAGTPVPQQDLVDMSFDLLGEPDWTFLLLTDTHITHTDPPWNHDPMLSPKSQDQVGKKDSILNIPRLLKVIDQANALKPAFVLHLGDMCTSHPQRPFFEGEVKNTLRLEKMFDSPVHFCAGNHDIGNKFSLPLPNNWPKSAGDPKICFHATLDNIAIYEEAFGPSYYSFDNKGCHFIVVNEQVFGSGFPIEKREWEWLEDDIATAAKSARMIFIAQHTPLYWVDPVKDIGPGNYEVVDEEPRARLLGLCKKYDVKAVFTGHTHHPISNRYENTLLDTITSTAFARNTWKLYEDLSGGYRPPARAGYAVVRIYGDEFIVNHVRTVDQLAPAESVSVSRPRRLVARSTRESLPGSLALTAAPTRFVDHDYSPSRLIDGVTEGPESKSLAGHRMWRSGKGGAHWIEIEFAEARNIVRVEIFGYGDSGPGSATIETKIGDQEWKTAVKDFECVEETQSISFKSALAKRVRVSMGAKTKAGAASGSIAITEIRVFDDTGRNVASEDKASRVTASTIAHGNRPQGYTCDNSWTSALDMGASIVRIDPERFTFDKIHQWPETFEVDPYMLPALNLACWQGATLMIPLEAPEGTSLSDMVAVASNIEKKLPPGKKIWEVRGKMAEDATIAALRKALGLKEGEVVRAGLPLDGLMQSAGKNSGCPVAVTAKCGQLTRSGVLKDLKTSRNVVMAQFEGDPDLNPIDAVRAYIACRASNVTPCFDFRPGKGILDVHDNPTPAYYALRAAQTTLGAAEAVKPRDLSADFKDKERTIRAFWNSSIAVAASKGFCQLVDPATGTITNLNDNSAKGKRLVAAKDMPRFLVRGK